MRARLSVYFPSFLQLENRAIFAWLYHEENIQGEGVFPASATHHVTCTRFTV